MAELKARRQGKQKREEEETARREEQRKKEEEEEEEKQSAGKNSVKLKTSDIYSDDSDSEGRKFEYIFCCSEDLVEKIFSSDSFPNIKKFIVEKMFFI